MKANPKPIISNVSLNDLANIFSRYQTAIKKITQTPELESKLGDQKNTLVLLAQDIKDSKLSYEEKLRVLNARLQYIRKTVAKTTLRAYFDKRTTLLKSLLTKLKKTKRYTPKIIKEQLDQLTSIHYPTISLAYDGADSKFSDCLDSPFTLAANQLLGKLHAICKHHMRTYSRSKTTKERFKEYEVKKLLAKKDIIDQSLVRWHEEAMIVYGCMHDNAFSLANLYYKRQDWAQTLTFVQHAKKYGLTEKDNVLVTREKSVLYLVPTYEFVCYIKLGQIRAAYQVMRLIFNNQSRPRPSEAGTILLIFIDLLKEISQLHPSAMPLIIHLMQHFSKHLEKFKITGIANAFRKLILTLKPEAKNIGKSLQLAVGEFSHIESVLDVENEAITLHFKEISHRDYFIRMLQTKEIFIFSYKRDEPKLHIPFLSGYFISKQILGIAEKLDSQIQRKIKVTQKRNEKIQKICREESDTLKTPIIAPTKAIHKKTYTPKLTKEKKSFLQIAPKIIKINFKKTGHRYYTNTKSSKILPLRHPGSGLDLWYTILDPKLEEALLSRDDIPKGCLDNLKRLLADGIISKSNIVYAPYRCSPSVDNFCGNYCIKIRLNSGGKGGKGPVRIFLRPIDEHIDDNGKKSILLSACAIDIKHKKRSKIIDYYENSLKSKKDCPPEMGGIGRMRK